MKRTFEPSQAGPAKKIRHQKCETDSEDSLEDSFSEEVSWSSLELNNCGVSGRFGPGI